MYCLNCETVIKIKKADYKRKVVNCKGCGYVNELDDIRIEWYAGIEEIPETFPL